MIKGIKKYGKADRRCDMGNYIVVWGIMDLSQSDVVISRLRLVQQTAGFRLHPTFILDVYKVFWKLEMM